MKNNNLESKLKNLELLNIKLKENQEAKSSIFANICHDLRAPLTSIHSYLEMISSDIISDENIKKTYIERSILRINDFKNLINDFNNVIINEKKENALNMENVKSLIDGVYLKYELDIKSQNIIFTKLFCEDIENLYINADKKELYKVFGNLITNSLKYTDSGGEIAIGCKTIDNYIEFWISDTGKGISEKYINQIFNRFYTVKELNNKYVGTGLGLDICNEIIKKHNGTMRVESTEGIGSTFFFKLKVAKVGQ